MTYEVILLSDAEQGLNEAADWWAEHRDAEEATAWLKGFRKAVAGLSQHPYRCPLARENSGVPFELRHLLFGLGSRITHRAIFFVDEESKRVIVHAIRHVSQATLSADYFK